MGKLEAGVEKLGITPTEKQWEQLRTYIDELERWNELYSLVNASGDDLIIRHILDSLTGLSLISERGKGFSEPKLADMGSGGGLPGIILAIFLPLWKIDLVERSGKRVNFLNDMVMTLNLTNVRVLQKDLKQVKETYDMITFRAFRPFLPEIIKGLKKTLAQDGVIAAYKGKKSSIREETKLLQEHFSLIQSEPLSVPFLKEERHLLFLSR